MNNKYKGIGFIILSAFGFALMSVFVKLSGDIPVMQKVLFRNGVSMIIGFGMIVTHTSQKRIELNDYKWLILRSSFGTIGMVLFFFSISELVLSDANMINKLSTFFLIGFSAIFLKESIKRYQIIAIIVAFIGTLFIIKPVFDVEIIPYLAAVFAAIFAGAAYTTLRYLGNKVEYYKVVFFFSSFSSVVLLPFVLFNYEAMDTKQVVYLLLGGIFATVGQFGVTLAYKYAPANEISIFNYFNVLFAALFSVLIFSEFPDIYSLIGYVIVFGASYYMFIKKAKLLVD